MMAEFWEEKCHVIFHVWPLLASLCDTFNHLIWNVETKSLNRYYTSLGDALCNIMTFKIEVEEMTFPTHPHHSPSSSTSLPILISTQIDIPQTQIWNIIKLQIESIVIIIEQQLSKSKTPPDFSSLNTPSKACPSPHFDLISELISSRQYLNMWF